MGPLLLKCFQTEAIVIKVMSNNTEFPVPGMIVLDQGAHERWHLVTEFVLGAVRAGLIVTAAGALDLAKKESDWNASGCYCGRCYEKRYTFGLEVIARFPRRISRKIF